MLKVIHILDNMAAFFKKKPAGFSQSECFPPLEQSDAEVFFEFFDLHCDCGLRIIQFFSRAVKASASHDFMKRL